jgi:uncharacterized protein
MSRYAPLWDAALMFGHQLVPHVNPPLGPDGRVPTHWNAVDAHALPVPHFGRALSIPECEALAARCPSFVDHFIIEPYVRFKDQPGEQCTLFFEDPSGNALEFKAFADIEKAALCHMT